MDRTSNDDDNIMDIKESLMFVPFRIMLLNLTKISLEIYNKYKRCENSDLIEYFKFLDCICKYAKNEPSNLSNLNLFVGKNSLYFTSPGFHTGPFSNIRFRRVNNEHVGSFGCLKEGTLKICNWSFMNEYYNNNPFRKPLYCKIEGQSFLRFEKGSMMLMFPYQEASLLYSCVPFQFKEIYAENPKPTELVEHLSKYKFEFEEDYNIALDAMYCAFHEVDIVLDECISSRDICDENLFNRFFLSQIGGIIQMNIKERSLCNGCLLLNKAALFVCIKTDDLISIVRNFNECRRGESYEPKTYRSIQIKSFNSSITNRYFEVISQNMFIYKPREEYSIVRIPSKDIFQRYKKIVISNAVSCYKFASSVNMRTLMSVVKNSDKFLSEWNTVNRQSIDSLLTGKDSKPLTNVKVDYSLLPIPCVEKEQLIKELIGLQFLLDELHVDTIDLTGIIKASFFLKPNNILDFMTVTIMKPTPNNKEKQKRKVLENDDDDYEDPRGGKKNKTLNFSEPK